MNQEKDIDNKDNGFSAVHRMFNNRSARKFLLALRFPLAIGVLVLMSMNIDPNYFWPGLIVTAIGEFIQVWCFSALKKKKILAVKGLYVLVRNPMYLGRYLILFGFFLLLGQKSLWLLIVFTAVYYFYMVNRVKREEAVLIEIFGESYKQYCKDVNRFFPSFKNVDWKSLPYFRKELFFRNNAHWNMLGTILCYVFFYYMTFKR
ncbi:MAG: isoprenylcysteine carboxylmethyltransferase family protein [Kiritimatiellae bacterium]|nr:isoprenylcysteine carboxylmethyltransferase family protein [Kiritimatiellia bacterium]